MTTRGISISAVLFFVCASNGTAAIETQSPNNAKPDSVSASTTSNKTTPKDFAGRWMGQISLPGMPLKISPEFTVEGPQQQEALSGTIDIPAQSARGLPLERIRVEDSTIWFTIKGIPGTPTFAGVLKEDGTLTGEFTQGEIRASFELKRGELPKTVRRQDPKPPFPYELLEAKVPVASPGVNGLGEGHELAGTITKPAGTGPFTAVVLVTGSGPQNRDEEIMDHRPFWVIADNLSRAGILVLRCDDRGFGKSGGKFETATTEDFVDDALACVKYLKARSDVARVGIVGHSEGGMIAPMAAAKSSDVAFIVMLAGTAVPGHELLTKQNELIAIASGVPEDQAKELAAKADEVFRGVNAAMSDERLRERIHALVSAQQKAMSGGAEQPVDPVAMEATVNAQFQTLTSPWFRFFLKYDPQESIARVGVPVLAMNGDLDVQVDADQNLPAIEAALAKAGNRDVTIMKMEGLNHLFQKCGVSDGTRSSGGLQWYATNPETFNPAALQDIREWVLKRFPVDAPKEAASGGAIEAKP